MKTSEVWIMYDKDDRIEAVVGDLNFVRNMKNAEQFNEPDMHAITPRGSVKLHGRWYRLERQTVYHSDDAKE